MTTAKDNNRIFGIDLIKVIACFAVVVLHTCYSGKNINLSGVLYYSGVIAIPLFFMVNGYLLFGRTQKDKWYAYKKIGRIVLLSMLCLAARDLLHIREYFSGEMVNPLIQFRDSLFLQRGSFFHFWFFGSLILIYLLFRPLDYLYIHYRKWFCGLVVLLLISQCAVDGLNIFFAAEYQDLLSLHIPQAFRLEIALSYFCLGGFIKRYHQVIIKYISGKIVLLLYLLVIVYQMGMVRYLYPNCHCEYFYDNILVIVLCFSLFSFLSCVKKPLLNDWMFNAVSELSNCVMLIYILHTFVLWRIPNGFPPLRLLVCFGVTALLSGLLLRVPYVKHIVRI